MKLNRRKSTNIRDIRAETAHEYGKKQVRMRIDRRRISPAISNFEDGRDRKDTEEAQNIRYTVKRRDQVVQGKKLK